MNNFGTTVYNNINNKYDGFLGLESDDGHIEYIRRNSIYSIVKESNGYWRLKTPHWEYIVAIQDISLIMRIIG